MLNSNIIIRSCFAVNQSYNAFCICYHNMYRLRQFINQLVVNQYNTGKYIVVKMSTKKVGYSIKVPKLAIFT